jgi:signal transduction histidine kinase
MLLAAIIPTILTTPIGVILLVSGGSDAVTLVAGVLVLAFCASAISGYVLGSIFLRRSASLVNVQNEFLASVSHELRTPMTSMRMFVEALQDNRLKDPSEREKCLSILQNEMLRLDSLLAKLIDLSRIETGLQPFAREPVKVQEIAEAATTAFEAIHLNADADLHLDIDENLQVIGDRSALIQVCVNLLSNAWKHGGKDQRIDFVIRKAGNNDVAFEVADHGSGIPASEQDRIFEMFERGISAEKNGTGGSGIGLAIAKAIVKRHSGRINLESRPGGGTKFLVTLPMHR